MIWVSTANHNTSLSSVSITQRLDIDKVYYLNFFLVLLVFYFFLYQLITTDPIKC